MEQSVLSLFQEVTAGDVQEVMAGDVQAGLVSAVPLVSNLYLSSRTW